MKEKNCLPTVFTAVFWFILWELLAASVAPRDIVLGIIVSIIVALFSTRFFVHNEGGKMWNPVRLLLMGGYAFGKMAVEIVKANVDVALRVFDTDMRLHPGIVRIPTELKDEYALSVLANSITLTPGTITMEVEEENGKNYFYVHWIDVQTRDENEAADAIKGSMEPDVRRIWE